MMRKWIHALGAAALLLASASVSSAADAPILSRIVKSGKLRVGMSGDQPPLNVKSKSGEIIGLEADLATLLAASMGVEATIVQKPFAELLPALEAGKVDMIMSGMTITPERNLKAAFVGPYFVSGKSILTKSSTLAAADEADDINVGTLTLAALKGSTSQEFVEVLLPKAKLKTTKNYEEAVKLVLDDQANAMVADYPICLLTALRHPEAKLATLDRPLTVEPIGIALPPNDPLFLNLVQNYLGAIAGTGLLEGLQDAWFEDASWLAELP